MSTYSNYKQCDGDWINEIPISWSLIRAKYLFEIKKRIVGELGPKVLSITQKGIKVKDTESGGGQLSMDYSKYQIVEPGDFAMNQMDLLTGYVDISKYQGVTSPDYRVFSLKKDIGYSRYLLYVLQMAYRSKVFFKYGKGASHLGRWRLPSDGFNNFWVPIPPKEEIKKIVAFLDYEISRIDVLMTEQYKLVETLKEKRNSLVHNAIKGAKEVRLNNCSDIISRPIKRESDKEYTPIGLFNRGRGIFHKELILGKDLGDSIFYYIQPHDLVLSGQFAWEGAVALSDEEEEACIASHRYPILNGKKDILDTTFLWAFFTSQKGAFLLNENSKGAAGRNRPLNINSLMKENVPVPSLKVQKIVSQAVIEEKILNESIKRTISKLEERRTALIHAVVTGQVDVSNFNIKEEKKTN
jgi:type I restriction enzyme S subunit